MRTKHLGQTFSYAMKGSIHTLYLATIRRQGSISKGVSPLCPGLRLPDVRPAHAPVRRHLHQGHIDAIRSILGGRNGAVLSSSIQNASFKALTAVPHPDDGAMDDLEAYTSDWTRLYSGGTCVCFPSDTTEVSRVLKYCNEQQIGVVPQGGNTGLVGGAVARNPHELIVSLRRMNRIIEIDVDSAVLYCEAGCVLESLMQALEPHGLIVPLDLGAKGSCQIGGNVSTNAGGLRVVRYGSMQANVLGLEVVLADGTIIDMLRGLRKDNCGYHLRHLFVGAEGSLGVVTKVAMQLFPKPKNTMAILFKLASFVDITLLLRRVRSDLGDVLTAFEFMDGRSLNAVMQAQPELLRKIGGSLLTDVISEHCQSLAMPPSSVSSSSGEGGISGPVVALVELSYGDGIDAASSSSRNNSNSGTSSDDAGDKSNISVRELVESFCADLMTRNDASSLPLVQDVLVSQNETQTKAMWRVRESVPVSLMDLMRRWQQHGGSSRNSNNTGSGSGDNRNVSVSPALRSRLFKYDVSLRVSQMSDFVLSLKAALTQRGHRVLLSRPPVPLTPGSEAAPREEEEIEAESLDLCCFGHIGDGNLHLNLLLRCGTEATVRALQSDLDSIVYAEVIRLGGSISAEHGVGQQKAAVLSSALAGPRDPDGATDASSATARPSPPHAASLSAAPRSAPEVAVMRAVKAALDPRGIMNPGKVLA